MKIEENWFETVYEKLKRTSKNFLGPARECNELAINAKNSGEWLKDNTQKYKGLKWKGRQKKEIITGELHPLI